MHTMQRARGKLAGLPSAAPALLQPACNGALRHWTLQIHEVVFILFSITIVLCWNLCLFRCLYDT